MKATYVDHMGSDLSVVNAARVSFDKKSDKFDETRDARLIRYLAKHNHWTPFGHTSITIHCKAPIFVARQLGKHQTGLVWNEVSRRYVDSEPEFFVPDSWRLRAKDKKQGSSETDVVVLKGQQGKCPQCGDTFTSASNSQRYCSPTCQSKSWRTTHEGWKKNKWSRLKQSANKRGVYFDISWEDIPAPESCVYLNIPLKYDNTKVSGDSASVDRIDNTKGYIKGNIQTISNKANSMKSVASDEEIVTFSKAALAQHGGYITPQTDTVSEFYGEMKRLYTYLIDSGVCPEQARMFMPQSQLTEWYWTGSLAAFARVCNLRLAPDTQKETRDIAKDISGIMRELYPVSWEALVDSA